MAKTPDDYPASTNTTGTVEVGGSVTGKIDFSGDRDWFAVTLEEGRSYWINIEGASTYHESLRDPLLAGVYDTDSQRISNTGDNNSGIGRNSRKLFTPEASGTYYIGVGHSGGSYVTGTYRLSVTDAANEYSADTGTTGTVAVGGSVTEAIQFRGDEDWFAVTLEAGQLYRIDLEGSPTNAGTLTNPILRGVYDDNANLVGGADNDGGAGRNSRGFFEPETDGVYYISAEGVDHYAGTYRLSLAEVEDDYRDYTNTTGAVTVGGSATGEIDHPGDQDWFKVTLQAGTTYAISLQGDEILDTPVIRGVHDANGRRIGSTLSYEGRLSFEPQADGDYYISAGGYGRQTGSYRVSVRATTTREDDHPANTGTTGRVTVGGSTTGNAEFVGDVDWFAVTLEARTRYVFVLEGASTGDGTLRDPYLRGVYDASGRAVPGVTGDGRGFELTSRILFEPESGGTYYVAAGGVRKAVGSYRLSAWEFNYLDDYASHTGTAGEAVMNGSVTGMINHVHDQDWFKVTLEAGRLYRIDLEDIGRLRDPFLRGVYDAQGRLIANTTNDDGGEGTNSLLYFTPSTGGVHYIAAGAWGRYYNGTYRLSVTNSDLGDDYPAHTGTDGKVAVNDSVTGDISLGDDRDWFRVTLQAGTRYKIDLEGSWTDGGTLFDPLLHGVYDEHGMLIADTSDDDSGSSLNSRVFFTPEIRRNLLHRRRRGSHKYRHLPPVRDGPRQPPPPKRRRQQQPPSQQQRRPQRRRLFSQYQHHRECNGGRVRDGEYRDFTRPGLVQGLARSGDDVPDRPRGRGHEPWNAVRPLPARRLQQLFPTAREYHRRRLGRGRQRHRLLPAGERRRLLHRRRGLRQKHRDLPPEGEGTRYRRRPRRRRLCNQCPHHRDGRGERVRDREYRDAGRRGLVRGQASRRKEVPDRYRGRGHKRRYTQRPPAARHLRRERRYYSRPRRQLGRGQKQPPHFHA